MATQQFESAKKLILHFTQKNCMSPESDIKGVMPGECTFASAQRPHRAWERLHPFLDPSTTEGPLMLGLVCFTSSCLS